MTDFDFLRAYNLDPWLARQDLNTWGWFCVAVVVILLIAYIGKLRDPRYMERVMARKMEREKMCNIITVALEKAMTNKEITVRQQQKYLAKIGKALDIPDMVPRSQQVLPFKFKPNLVRAKAMALKRLTAMGVNIEAGLDKLRRSRTKKLKYVKRLPLP